MIDTEPQGALEFRTAKPIDVRWPDRVIELIVMPYEEETVVPFKNTLVREICSRGAFDGVERRANRIRANRDHDLTRTVGRAIAIHPSREVGCVAEIRIAQTPLGDETLALAEDEILDASAGFLPFPGGEQWLENRSLRRLNRVWLGHIAFTPDPAYEGANVLSVRTGQLLSTIEEVKVPTPNLDQIRLWQMERRFNSGIST